MYYNLNRLKPRSTFMVGCGIGFLGTLFVFIFFHDTFVTPTCKSSLPGSSAGRRSTLLKWLVNTWNEDKEIIIQTWKNQPSRSGETSTYSQWLTNQNIRIDNIDLDSYLYGSEKDEELESDWLSSNVQVTCIVLVTKVKLARSIWNTWGKRCNNIYFFGQKKDFVVPIITFDMKLVSSWQLLCEAFNYVWKSNKNNLEWLITVKDDTLVVPENLRYMLAPLNHTNDYYLGHAVVLWGQPYNVANAGYVISKGVLKKLIGMFNNSEMCITGGKYWKQEDYYLAKHLASMGIYPSDTRDQYSRGTFHGYSLQSLLWGVVKTGSYWTRALYPIKDECCSFMSVTFNVGEPDKMYTLHYLLYRLHVLRKEAIFGARRSQTIIPDEDVWKIALEEEFNITNLNNITSDAYYEIWHSKYSEPEQLMNMNYRRKILNRST